MVVLVAGCASTSAATGQKNQNVITSEEIAGQSSAATAYDVIQRLRPNFLRTRGAVHGSPSGTTNNLEQVDLVVYLNETRLGGTDELRQIPTTEIREIRYYSASDATTKWGTGHSAGAIQVFSR
jgi:hypothetical protein